MNQTEIAAAFEIELAFVIRLLGGLQQKNRIVPAPAKRNLRGNSIESTEAATRQDSRNGEDAFDLKSQARSDVGAR